ncbi:MAG TPA: DUF3108 domain-containing protein [Ideonella sp.]|uniref:DUF3108 domain-containing protein n=1 Tax=Ideonella sp. TaxID=1929293 RepID=UPI002E373D19|nr:DUF3108 domain-containing protein [Ideonella sp.]HEX5682523.1 DUF3108 domain-containing protein [Ideonella sp.]
MPWPAFTFPAPTQLPARAPAVNWRRRGQAAAVVLAVLLAHGWLIGPVHEPIGRAPGHSPAIQLVTLPPAKAPAPAPEVIAAPTPTPSPPAEPPPLLAAPEPAPASEHRPPPDGPIDWMAGPRPPESVAGTEPTPADEAGSTPAAPVPGTVASAQDIEGGGRPPIYTTQRPEQSFKLDYRVERGDDAGTAQLSYDLQTGGIFRVRFTAEVNGKAVMDWMSRGFFNAAGFAPQRMVERQRGIDARAVNFQRDEGVITFSSSSRAFALHPGAQDRTSMLLQLVAIAQAQPGGLRAGQHIRMQVASLRGHVGEWDFEVVGDGQVEPNGVPIPVVHLRREPSQPYDQRIELWLARDAGHLPVGLRFTQVPGRSSEAFWLSTPLPAVEAPSSAPPRSDP